MRKALFAPLLAVSALALTATPAFAGKEDRARAAIAAAEAKIHTAETMGAGTAVPEEAAAARAALARAKEHFAADRNTQANGEAISASELADTAIGHLQADNKQALSNERAARDAEVSAANQQAVTAQQDATDARARAAMAERSAADSAIQAQAARDQAALAREEANAKVETTVTTQQAAPRRATTTVKKTSTARRAVAAPTTTTTTTVRQTN